MKRLSWKYVAGLVDGEGCVSLGIRTKKNKDSVSMFPQIILELTLTESCKHLIDLLHNNYGGRVYRIESRNENWKPCYNWRLAEKRKCRALFQNIVNHCFIKNEQMRLAIWCYDNLKGKISTELKDVLKSEFKLQKSDPHRLSETAVLKIKALMR